MSLSSRFFGLALLAAMASSPALADVPSPEEEIREHQVARWYSANPGTAPVMEAVLAPDGKAIAVSFKTRTPASYRLYVNGRKAASGSIRDLEGGARTDLVSLAEHPEEDGAWAVQIEFGLRGLAGEGPGRHESGDDIAGCLRRRYALDMQGGKRRLKALDLNGEDLSVLRRCGL